MADDLVLSIRLTADGKGLVGEVRGSAEELKKFGQAAQQSNQQARSSSDEFVASLRRQADTLGLTKTQTLAYEASQHNLTAAQRAQVAGNIKAIEAHERHQNSLTVLRTGAIALGLSLAGLIAAMHEVTARTIESQQANLKLQAVLIATGHAAGLSKAELDHLAEAMKRATGFDDDQLRSSMAVMLTFKQVTGDTFRQAMEMAANLSKLLGQDLQSSVLQLGKAMEDPEAGLTALRRAGVSFNATQKDMIKDLVDTGQQARALTLLLQIMREQGIDKTAESMNRGLFKATNDVARAWDDMLKTMNQSSTGGFVLHTIKSDLEAIKMLFESPEIGAMFGARGGRIRGPDGAPVGAPAGGPTREQLDALDKVKEYLKEFRSDNDKLAEELRKFRTLAGVAGLTAQETAAGEAKISAKLFKPGEGAALILSLKNQIAELENVGSKTQTVDRVTRELTESGKKFTAQEKESSIALAKKHDNLIAGKQALDAYLKTMEFDLALEQEMAEVIKRRDDQRAAGLLDVQKALEQGRDEVQLAEFELSIMSRSEAEREVLLAQFKAEAEWRRRINELKEKGILLDGDEQRLRRQADEAVAAAGDAARAKGRQKAIEDTRQAAKRLDEDLQRGLVDSIFRGFEAGKDIAKNFRDSLVNLFKATILTPVIKWIVSPITGAITATLGGLGIPGLGNAAGAGGAVSGLGGGFSGLGDLLGGVSSFGNSIFQNLGVASGSQFLADIGNFGFGVPILGGLIGLATGGVKTGAGALAGGVLGNFLLPGIGGVLGSAAGGLLGGLFGGGGHSASGTGYQLTGSARLGTGFSGQLYGLSASDEASYISPLRQEGEVALFNQQLAQAYNDIQKLAKVMGLDASVLANQSFSINATGPLNGGDPRATINNAILQVTDQMEQQLIPNIKNLQQANESLTQTFVRLAAASEQLRQKQTQMEQTLAGAVRGLPGQLGITGLKSARDALRVAEFQAPLERYAAAREFLTATYGRAIGGNLEAVQAFPQLLQQALTIGRDVFASGPQFQELFLEGNRQLNDLLNRQQDLQTEILSDVPLTIQQASQDQIAELRRGFKTVTDQLAAVQDELRRLREAA